MNRMNKKHHTITNRKTFTAAALVLSLALSVQFPAATVLAAGSGSYFSYEDYRSGSASYGKNKNRQYQTIEIKTKEDLAALAEECRLDSWSYDKLVKLTADIVLSEEDSLSIPSFSGIFDGQNHKISNLRLSGAGSAQGLFRYLQEGGIVRNLKVEGRIRPQGSENQVGGIVGINYGLVYNCSFQGTVNGDNEVGGIAGQNASCGEIRRCSSSAVVTGSHSVGGIVGSNHGTLNNCTNTGDVNTYGTEVTYDLEDLTMENLEDINSTANVSAHTDTGGIAGISDGKIYYCTNSGNVGYQHVGYNVGGIVGRLSQGYLQNCTNTGQVLGRKDVAGIAGQMEPFLEVQYMKDNLSRLDEELDVTIDLLDRLHGDIRGYGKQASDLAKNLTVNLKNVSAAAGNLSSAGNDLWYIYNQELTGISNDLKTLGEEMKDPSGKGDKDSQTDQDNKDSQDNQEENGPEDGTDKDHSVSSGDLEDIWQDIKDHVAGSDTNGGSGDDSNADHNGGNSGDGNADHNGGNSGNGNADHDGGNSADHSADHSGNNDKGIPDFDGMWDEAEAYKAALLKFGTSAGKHMENMTSATWDRAGTVTGSLEIMDKEMKSACDYLGQLADVLEAGTDRAGEDVDALVEQAKVLRSLMSGIRDDLFSYEGITVEDTSDEAAGGDMTDLGAGRKQGTSGDGGSMTDSAAGRKQGASGDGGSMTDPAAGRKQGASGDAGSMTDSAAAQEQDASAANREEEDKLYDTSSFQKGKITLCLNQGTIEADTNVGGIVGQISTEFDFDPEDDITLSGTESFNMEQTLKAVVRESRNAGQVTGKKDCVGGIVGKADFGAVISCESYAGVSSTGGSNVGGIAGSSSYAVRSCYSIGDLSGKNNVGGIVGKGCDIFYSYAMNTLEVTGECSGAIAGTLQNAGTLYGNCYVAVENGGVDGIGYQGGATPMPYEEFSKLEHLPEDFTTFTITFRAQGEQLAVITCRYGESISEDQIPEIPEKEGCYGVWPEFDFDHVTCSRVLDAQYEKWVESLAGEETGEDGRPLLMVEGNFLPQAFLKTTKEQQDTGFVIDAGDGTLYDGPVKVHALCGGDPEQYTVEVLTDAGYRKTESSVLGRYVVFEMERPGHFRLVEQEKTGYGKWIALAAAGAAGVAALVLVIRFLIKKKKKQ